MPIHKSAYKLNSRYENFYHKGAKNTDYIQTRYEAQKINLVSRSDSLHDEGLIEAPNFCQLIQGSRNMMFYYQQKNY